MFVTRNDAGLISGYTKWPNSQSTEAVDEESQEWLDFINSVDAVNQIQELEATVTPRRMREAALTDEGKAWLQNIDDQIAALRG